jgi:hypothetical protein
MAKDKNPFTNFDTPYMVQPPKGAAEPGIDYGKVTDINEAHDPMGVMPAAAKQHNIGPTGGEGTGKGS